MFFCAAKLRPTVAKSDAKRPPKVDLGAQFSVFGCIFGDVGGRGGQAPDSERLLDGGSETLGTPWRGAADFDRPKLHQKCEN